MALLKNRTHQLKSLQGIEMHPNATFENQHLDEEHRLTRLCREAEQAILHSRHHRLVLTSGCQWVYLVLLDGHLLILGP